MLHAPVVLIADYAGTLQVGDTSELRLRYSPPANGAGTPTGPATAGSTPFGMDVYTQPQLRLRLLTHGGWEFLLGDAVTLTWEDVELGPCSTCLFYYDTGNASIGWRNRTVSINLSEDASGGLFTALAGPLPQAVTPPGQMMTSTQGPPTATVTQQALPNTTIKTGSTHTALTMQAQLNRQASMSLGVSYLLSGGLDAVSRETLPLQYGPRADASFTYSLTRRDQLVTMAYVMGSQFGVTQCFNPVTGLGETDAMGNPLECEPDAWIEQISEGIRHAIGRQTELSLDAGVSAVENRLTNGAAYDNRPFPNAHAALSHRFGPRGTSSVLVEANLLPVVDWRSGLVQERLQGQLSLLDEVAPRVTLHVAANGSTTVPTDAPLAAQLVGGLAEVTYKKSRTLLLTAGLRGWWQDQSPTGAFSSFLLYLDVTVLAPALRF